MSAPVKSKVTNCLVCGSPLPRDRVERQPDYTIYHHFGRPVCVHEKARKPQS